MAIADEIYDETPKYTSKGLHKAAAEGGPQGVNTPVTTILRSNPLPQVQADPIPSPTPNVELAKPAVPAAQVEADKPAEKKETISLQAPTVTERVEFSPPPSVTGDSGTSEISKKKTPKTQALEDKSMDLLSQGLDFIKNMAEGGDPTIQAQFNSWLNKFSLSNASERSALMMNLRSQPGYVAGSGEGTAALLMMSRGTNTTMADMMSKMSIANVQFMMDANKLGIEKAIQVKNFINEQETHELQNQISELSIKQGELGMKVTEQNLQNNELKTLQDFGQYDQIAQILNKKYPGLSVSAASIRSADPATLNAMTAQKDSIAALVETGNASAEAAKQQAIGYYSQFWQNEGFKSQEEAIAFANKLDFTAAAFKARSSFIDSAATAVRNYAVQKDSSAGKAAVVDYYKAVGRDPSSVGASLTPEQVTEMRKFFDPTSPVVTDTTAEDKKQLGIDWEWYQQSKAAAGVNTVGAVYNSFAEAAKAAGTPFDADQEKYVKSWINQKLTYGDLSANTSAPNGYTINDKATQLPWDDPATSFYFTTWPKYDFSGEQPVILDAGGQRYSSLNGTNYGAYTAAEDKRLDNAYMAFLADPKHDKTMTRDQWYFASKGGTVDLVKNPPAIAPAADRKEQVENFNNIVDTKGGFATQAAKDKFKTDIVNANNVAVKLDLTNVGGVPDTAMNQMLLRDAKARLATKGVFNSDQVYKSHSVGTSNTMIGMDNSHTVWNTNRKGMDYAMFTYMVNNGLSEADAKAALAAMVGQERADIAMMLENPTSSLTSGTGTNTGAGGAAGT